MLLEVGVELLDPAVHGDRHQEAAASETDQGLDVALLVGPAHQAEVVPEQVMTSSLRNARSRPPTILATAILELS